MHIGGNKMQTMETARHVADVLIQIPQVEEVFLFGSVARDGEGNDLDIILVVSDDVFRLFAAELNRLARRESARQECYDFSYEVQLDAEHDSDFMDEWLSHHEELAFYAESSRKGSRSELLLLECIGPFAETIFRKLDTQVAGMLEVLCMPPGWQDKLETLQDILPHKDPEFMQNISGDVVKLC